MSTMPEEKERPSGIAGVIWTLEHAQDLVSVVVGVLLLALAGVMLVLGVVDFFRDVADGPVETAVINVLNRILLVLILVEIMHTVVLSLRAHHLVTQPLLAVGLVAVIRKILFVLSSEEPVSTAELALLIAMIAVFVAALIVVSRYDPGDSAPTDLVATVFISAGPTSDHQRRDLPRGSLQHGAELIGQLAHRRRRPGEREVHRRYDRPGP
jgi:uncharacterized membrane protein (DUF373 family)